MSCAVIYSERHKPQQSIIMKKHFSIILAALPLVAILMFSCNRIDYVGYGGVSIAQQNASLTQSIKVTQAEALGIADMFMRSETVNPGVATKSASTKRVSSSATVKEDGQDLTSNTQGKIFSSHIHKVECSLETQLS